MNRVFSAGLEACAAAVVLIPLFLILNKSVFQNLRNTIVYLVFALYLSATYAVVGLPSILYLQFDPHFNFVPFAYMLSDFMNSMLNVILFVPLGFFLPVLWEKFKAVHLTIFFGFCMSLLIEILQIFTFRATDINDLMTNSLGTLVGYLAARILLKLVPSLVPGQNTKELFIICSCVFSVMFFVQPFLSNVLWEIIL